MKDGTITTWGYSRLLPHVVILLIEAVGSRFILSLFPLVVVAVYRVDVPLDGVPGGAPHLEGKVDHPDEEQEEETRQGGKPNHHINCIGILNEKSVIGLLAA